MIVFDAEPLIAFYGDEPGSDLVDSRIRAVESGSEKGFVNSVTCTEVHYVVRRDDQTQADEYLSRIRNWCQVIDAEAVWKQAAVYKHTYACALGDAYTLATADSKGATALVGPDDDFDGVSEVDIERFRDESV